MTVPSCLFIGPSITVQGKLASVDIFGPAKLGNVYSAVRRGYRCIGIVDGLFGDVPSVWHKEILFALSSSVVVYGASSIGALRAAEMCAYGMIGVGAIFRLYRQNALLDDDEVCVLHGPVELGYAPLSYPMINCRITLRLLRRRGAINARQEADLASDLKSVYFGNRTHSKIELAMYNRGGIMGASWCKLFWENYVDQKKRDAELLIKKMVTSTGRREEVSIPDWVETTHWRRAFSSEFRDNLLPAGE